MNINTAAKQLTISLMDTIRNEEGERVSELFEEFEYEYGSDAVAMEAMSELRDGLTVAGLI